MHDSDDASNGQKIIKKIKEGKTLARSLDYCCLPLPRWRDLQKSLQWSVPLPLCRRVSLPALSEFSSSLLREWRHQKCIGHHCEEVANQRHLPCTVKRPLDSATLEKSLVYYASMSRWSMTACQSPHRRQIFNQLRWTLQWIVTLAMDNCLRDWEVKHSDTWTCVSSPSSLNLPWQPVWWYFQCFVTFAVFDSNSMLLCGGWSCCLYALNSTKLQMSSWEE